LTIRLRRPRRVRTRNLCRSRNTARCAPSSCVAGYRRVLNTAIRGRSAMPTPRVRTGSPRSPYRSPSAPPGAQRPRQAQEHVREQRTCPPPESRAARTDRPARAHARVARTRARRHGSASPGRPRRSADREPTRAALPRTAAPARGHRPENSIRSIGITHSAYAAWRRFAATVGP
jgi:hypothetical protein